MSKRLRILTWHVHGNYLYSLTQLPHDFIIPVMPDNRPGYAAMGPGLPWGSNVTMVAVQEVRNQELDCIIYQSRQVYEQDRESLLSAGQRNLPCIYIEHNPPEPHPTDTQHIFRHEHGVIVHVTHYNALMWDCTDRPYTVIEHGVPEPAVRYDGSLQRGIVVINNLGQRGRRIGADIYDSACNNMPLDLIGMGSPVNLGNTEEVSVLDIANRVRSLASASASAADRSEIEFKPLPPDDPELRCPDIGLASNHLGWHPTISFDAGLERTYSYFSKTFVPPYAIQQSAGVGPQ